MYIFSQPKVNFLHNGRKFITTFPYEFSEVLVFDAFSVSPTARQSNLALQSTGAADTAPGRTSAPNIYQLPA
jgi:hypothetical protein